LTRTSDV